MNKRLIAAGTLVDTAERDLSPGNHGSGWALVIIAVAVAGLGFAMLAANNLIGTLGSIP